MARADDIFGRIINPTNPTMTPEVARANLQPGCPEADHARMAGLARGSNNSELSDDE